MTESPYLRLAQRTALAVPALLLAGAYVSQYVFGLYPCEMCWWQRWPHFAAVALALLSFVAPPKRLWIALAEAEGSGTRLLLRSASRVGKSDLGQNARNLQELRRAFDAAP